MFCPGCSIAIAAHEPVCPACGFHLARPEALLGTHQVVLTDRLIDPTKVLHLGDFQALERCVDDFERQFSSVSLSVFVGDLPGGIVSGEAAVWLLNHASIQRHQRRVSPARAIVLVIHPQSAEAGIAVGYSLESWLTAEVLRETLTAMRHHLWHREFLWAVRGIARSLGAVLRRAGRAQLRRSQPAQPLPADHLGLPKAGTLPPRRPESQPVPPA